MQTRISHTTVLTEESEGVLRGRIYDAWFVFCEVNRLDPYRGMPGLFDDSQADLEKSWKIERKQIATDFKNSPHSVKYLRPIVSRY